MGAKLPYTMKVLRQKSFVVLCFLHVRKTLYIKVQDDAVLVYGFKRKYEGFHESFFVKVCVYNLAVKLFSLKIFIVYGIICPRI